MPEPVLARTRAVLSHTMHLSAPPERVFPLLCPVREYEWIERWRCEIVYLASGVAELDGIFRTEFPDDGPPEPWLITRYEPAACIEFVRMNALRAIRYRITLEPEGAAGTKATWTQVITALSEDGDRWVAQQTAEGFAGRMKVLERLLDHFLLTGECLKLQGPA